MEGGSLGEVIRVRGRSGVGVRIIQIGFNRCGTGALYEFFRKNSVPSVHWDHGRLARQMLFNILNGYPPFRFYENMTAFFDMETMSSHEFIEAFKFFPFLYNSYPDSLFVLNTRSVDAWLQSRLVHAQGDYARFYKKYCKIGSDEALLEYWQKDWNRHHARVRGFFSDPRRRKNFLEFNIDNDGPEKLVAALPAFQLDPSKYQRLYNSAGRIVLETAPPLRSSQ
jgi:hypothetical protein